MSLYLFNWLLVLALVNIVGFLVFAWDKYRALRNGWRIRESTLLLIAAMGASPAILLGQKVLRHKTRKQPFKNMLLILIVLQLGLLLSTVLYFR